MSRELERRKKLTALTAAGAVVAMTGLAFAAVPLYRVFCQATGFAGTPALAEVAPREIAERRITVRFDANTSKELPWRFRPVAREMTVRVGEQGLAHYVARSLAEVATTGRAAFNVTPLKAGRYFTKLDCFCFQEQRLAPGEEVEMGVGLSFGQVAVRDFGLGHGLGDHNGLLHGPSCLLRGLRFISTASREHRDAEESDDRPAQRTHLTLQSPWASARGTGRSLPRRSPSAAEGPRARIPPTCPAS